MTMPRRDFLTSAAVAGGAMALLHPVRAEAAYQCNAYGYCEVGVPSFAVYSAPQECQQWCWAATLQSIFATRGYLVSQQTIVRKLWGQLICAPAQPSQIWAAARGQWRDNYGRYFRAELTSIYDPMIGISGYNALGIMIDELAAGRPLVCGALGHATAISAISFQRSPQGPLLRSVTVRDPWPGNPNRRTLTMNELARTSFLATVAVS